MKVGEAEKYIREQLNGLYEEGESRQMALLVLEDCTGFSRTDFFLQKDQPLTTQQQHRLRQQVHRLQQHEPVQYVINKAWFYGMELYVDPRVLIPRPETEELVDWIVKDVKASGKDVFERGPMQADVTTQLKILDIGTGSGCIALALKKAMPKAEVWGCDVSEEALNVARRNGSALDIRVDFQGVDILEEVQHHFLPTVDIIVSNPPYIPLKEKETMHANVVNFEPHTALFVPSDNALLFYQAIAQFAHKRLYENGAVYLEIHENLGEAVVNLFRNEGFRDVELRKDLQGKERMVKVVNSQ